MLWLSKHERYSPRSMCYVDGVSQYPVDADDFSPGGFVADWSSNNTMGAAHGFMDAFLSVVDVDANAEQRSQPQITALYDDWYANGFQAVYSRDFTGFHHTGGLGYGWDRPPHNAMMNSILQNSLVAPPPLGGIWDQNLLYAVTMNLLPSAQVGQMAWGENVNFGPLGANNLNDYMPLYFLYRNTDLGKWFNWTLHNRLSTTSNYGNVPGTNLFWASSGSSLTSSWSPSAHWFYAFTDPNYPSTDMSTASVPTGVALNRVDATSDTTSPQSVLISRTGYDNVSDTLLNFYGLGEEFLDHNGPCGLDTCWYPGDYRIFKGNYLLAPDGGAAYGGPSTAVGAYWNNGGGPNSGYIEIGDTYNLLPVLNSKMPLAAADGLNRFAYAMVDSSASYATAVQVSRVQRHLIDFKEGGTQQFIVVYDSVATGQGETIRTYLHYPNNRLASLDSSKGDTSLARRDITSSYPGTGSGDATQLLTEVLGPAGDNSIYVYSDNANGTYAGGNNSTFRVSVCASTTGSSCSASATNAEFMVVHMPVTGSSGAMPSVVILASVDNSQRIVQIGGPSPKVAAFPCDGQTYTSAGFTTTHSGTAQYLIAGLSAGTYDVLGASPGVHGASVDPSDGTLYFESAAGDMRIVAAQ